MVENIFKKAGVNGIACGNVGETVIAAVCKSPAYDYLALELSSFQIVVGVIYQSMSQWRY
jgi:UDP-N-acetylmuramoylalanine--D-glutamate ligase